MRKPLNALLGVLFVWLALLAPAQAVSFQMGPASTTAPGHVTITAQSFKGVKTFADPPVFSGASVTALNASNLSTGTVPDARFPATLPAVSGANLTSLPAGNLTGTYAALSGASITSLTAANVTGAAGLSDGVLSANVPLLASANIFTATQTLTKASQSSTAESLAKWNVSDDATGQMLLNNISATNATFTPRLDFITAGSQTACTLRAQVSTDSAANAAFQFGAKTVGGAALATKPHSAWDNNGTGIMALSAAGGLALVGGTTPSVTVGTSVWRSGAGTPEGAVTAVVGSMYTRTDGGAGTTLYIKESGASNTGWIAK